MGIATRLDFASRRNEARVITLRFVGMDLTGVIMRQQVRLEGDTPGEPRIDLGTVSGSGQGLRLLGVADEGGVPVSTVRVTYNMTTMRDDLPFSGEPGSDTRLVHAIQLDGITRVYGDWWALASAIDSDSAPTDRPFGLGSQQRAPQPFSTASLTFAGEEVYEVSIDGVELLKPLLEHATAEAERSEAAAEVALEVGRSFNSVIDIVAGLVSQTTYAGHHLSLGAASKPAYAEPINPGTDATDGYLDALYVADLVSYAAEPGKAMALTGRWDGDASGPYAYERQSWLLCLSPQREIAFLYQGTDNAYRSVVSTAGLPLKGAPRFLRGLLNTKATPVAAELVVDRDAVVIPARAAAFFTSLDRLTWRRLGDVVTGLAPVGILCHGTAIPNPVVGFEGGDDTNPVGKVYEVVVRDSQKIMWNPVFADQEVGTRTFVDTAQTRNTWIVDSGAYIVSEDTMAAADVQLRPFTQPKLRCLNLNSDTNFWNDFWGVKWSTTEVTTMLDFAVGAGFNSVKVYSDGQTAIQPTGGGLVMGNPYPADNVMQQRIQWFAEQCRLRGLAIYLAQNQSSEFAQIGGADMVNRIALCRKHLEWWMAFATDLVACVDLNNEINGSHGGGARWGGDYGNGTPNNQAYSDLTALMAMGRQVLSCPITLSVFMNSPTHYVDNGWLDLQQDLGCDFHDVHPYHGFKVSDLPSLANVQALRSRKKYIGLHMIGECGCAEDGAPDQAGAIGGGYPGYQAAFARGMGACAQTPDSLGAVWFMTRPYVDGAGNTYLGSTGAPPGSWSVFGLLNVELDLVRPDTVAAIRASWPGARL